MHSSYLPLQFNIFCAIKWSCFISIYNPWKMGKFILNFANHASMTLSLNEEKSQVILRKVGAGFIFDFVYAFFFYLIHDYWLLYKVYARHILTQQKKRHKYNHEYNSFRIQFSSHSAPTSISFQFRCLKFSTMINKIVNSVLLDLKNYDCVSTLFSFHCILISEKQKSLKGWILCIHDTKRTRVHVATQLSSKLYASDTINILLRSISFHRFI